MEDLKDGDRHLGRWIVLFFAFALGNVIIFSVIFYQEFNPQWKKYQGGVRQVQFSKEPLRIQQIAVEKLNRADRCTTCHLGVEDSKYADAKEPFKTHPNYSQHPFERYGCTICHRGQGRAVDKNKAHGRVKHWSEPLLDKEYLESSCAKCHSDSNPKITPNVFAGKQLFGERACYGCHRIEDKGGRIGPELTSVGIKRDAAWLMSHFKNPQAVVPDSRMPSLELPEDELNKLTLYMLSRTGEAIPQEYQSVHRLEAEIEKRIRMATSPTEGGKAVFQKYGCATCHGPEGNGGVKNPNAQTGEEVPSLRYVKEGFTQKELKDRIEKGATPEKLNPQGPVPLRVMPAWKGIIGESELAYLVDYLFSIYPEEEAEKW